MVIECVPLEKSHFGQLGRY